MSIYKAIRIYGRADTPVVLDRLGYLSEMARGKSVLHIGCTDYPITEQRIERGQLLHARLQQTAADLLGIDISTEGLEVLRKKGYSNVVEMDAEEMNFDRKFDLVIAGDTLEHMSNPGRFVQSAAKVLAPNGELIIAVPSAFSFNVLRFWFQKVELTHKDHIAFHSPKTLAELCNRSGLRPTALAFTVQPADDGEGKLFLLARACVLRMWKNMAPSIIMRFKRPESVNLDQYFEWS
jgi:2-polyprenyl-3-methyl-5-hydroxy-6-metoxy-1,4-benzoquinol methylase